MKIDLNRPILDQHGAPIMDQDADGKNTDKVLVLYDVVQRACLAPLPGDAQKSGGQKAKLFQLAMNAKAGPTDLPMEDWTEIKNRIGEAFNVLIVGRAWEMIEETKPAAIEATPIRKAK